MKILVIAIVLAVAIAAVSIWGDCELKYKLDSAWCSVRHLLSDEGEFACRATAVLKKAGCLGAEGAHNSGLDL